MRVTRVDDLGDDRLRVVGVDDNGEEVEAQGWVSAMTNHFDAAHYGDDGHRVEDAQPREMTDEEKHAYWLQLLTEQAAPPQVLYEEADTE
jgi:hypothetical protein